MERSIGLLSRLRIWFIIELPAGNHMRLDPGAGQMESEVAEKLTCRRMVGKEDSIEKDDALHWGRHRSR